MLQESTITREGKGKQDDRSASYAVRDGDSAVTSSHVKKLEVAEMKMCRWACGHTLRDHVRDENIKERLQVESIAERWRKARLRWFGHLKRPRLPSYVGRKTLEMVPPGRRKRERPIQARDGWTVSTATWEPSERRKTRPWQNWLEENCVYRSVTPAFSEGESAQRRVEMRVFCSTTAVAPVSSSSGTQMLGLDTF